jgi:hypothetical protein
MLKIKNYVVLMIAFVVSVSLFASAPLHAATSTQSIAIPVYEYPTLPGLWPDIEAAGGSQVPFVIVNPASGPGVVANSDYTTRIADNTAAGIKSVGYVDTNYQARPIADVMNDIDMWYTLYPGIQGVMFDRVNYVDDSSVCYSAYAYNYAKIKHQNDPVVQNFGTYTTPAYEPYGDIFINAEMDHTLYQTWVLPTDGFQDNPAYSNRFWHLVHTTDSTDFASTLTQTRNNNAGWVYITDDTMPNPYSASPTYWNTELTSVGTLPASTIPNRGLTDLPAGCLDRTVDVTPTQTASTTDATLSVSNDSTTYDLPAPTEVTFDLPAGVTLNSVSGTGWACVDTTCTNGSTIAAGASTSDLAASFTADCSYQSGDIAITTTTFPQTEAFSTVAIARPTDCATGSPSANSGSTPAELASTGMNILSVVAIGVTLVGAGAIIYRKY